MTPLGIRSSGVVLFGALLASPATGQQRIWDHVGTGAPDAEPSSFAVIGDVNGDGVRDFLSGHSNFAYAIIRSGADAAQIVQHLFTGSQGEATSFGWTVTNLGYFDADSVEDYAIGAPSYTEPGVGVAVGLVRVYGGASHEVLAEVHGQVVAEYFGSQVVGLGDVNGDGFSDFGASTSHTQAFRVYLGPSGSFLREHVDAHRAQTSNAPYGDYDGDGFADYLVGQYAYSGVLPGQGRVRLHSGRTGELLLAVQGDRSYILAGFSVSSGGDWNGDGVDEIVAGAPGTTDWGYSTEPTGVYVFSGSDGTVLHFFDGADYCSPNSAFGWSVSSGKDVNGDGVPDLFVGAPLEPFGMSPGKNLRGSAFLFSGATRGLLWEYTGRHVAQHAGAQVRLLDDLNGDGLADWAVLSPDYDLDPSSYQEPDVGRLSVFAGAFGDGSPTCDGGANSVGPGAVLWTSGPISVGENALELVLSEMPQATPVLLIHGRPGAPIPFGGGELCIRPPLAVLAVVTTGSGGPPWNSNHARLAVDLRAPPFTTGGNIVLAGDVWGFQALYREFGQRNTSNALHVVFVP
jgi:hypothetical protein